MRVGEGAAQDVVQETWLRGVRALDGFRHGSSLKTWLTGILLNVCRERWRRERRQQSEESRDLAVESERFDGRTSPKAGDRQDLDRALAQLPEGARSVLWLHDVEGYTHAEIGDLLSISVGTSKSQLHRARRALRSALKPEETLR